MNRDASFLSWFVLLALLVIAVMIALYVYNLRVV